MTKKYLVVPGYVLSKSDGQRHYIDTCALMQLYGVNPEECLFRGSVEEGLAPLDLHPTGLTLLTVRYDGDYSLPTS